MEIRLLREADLPQALEVIHAGFATVAQEFGLTRENCPTNGAFISLERLLRDRERGAVMAGCFAGDRLIGCAQVRPEADGSAELEKLCVLPECRHGGAGMALVGWAEAYAAQCGADRLCIGIIARNRRLAQWYERIGFVSLGTQEFPFLPFVVEYMQKPLR